MTTPRRNVLNAYVWGVCGAAGLFAAIVGIAITHADLPNAGVFGTLAYIAGIGGVVASIAALVSLRRRS